MESIQLGKNKNKLIFLGRRRARGVKMDPKITWLIKIQGVVDLKLRQQVLERGAKCPQLTTKEHTRQQGTIAQHYQIVTIMQMNTFIHHILAIPDMLMLDIMDIHQVIIIINLLRFS